jgi:hypothetical protein
LWIYFCNNNPGYIYGCFTDIAGYAQCAVTVFIRGRYRDQGYIDRLFAGTEIAGDFTEKHGNIVGSSLIHCIPDIFANEESVYLKSMGMFRVCVRGLPFGMNAHQAYLFKFMAAGAHSAYQLFGRSGGGMYEYGLARLD